MLVIRGDDLGKSMSSYLCTRITEHSDIEAATITETNDRLLGRLPRNSQARSKVRETVFNVAGEIHIAKCRNPRCNGPLGVTRLAGAITTPQPRVFTR